MGDVTSDAILGRVATMLPYSTRATGRAFGSLAECPACGSDFVEVALEEIDVRTRCEACGRCWTVDSVGVFRVNPVACPGCAHRGACFEVLREDLAGWWSLPGLDPIDA